MGNFTVINVVSEYSADNTGATDTSTQINNALAAVPVGVAPNIAQGAIVYFPKGTYLIQKPLVRQVSYTRCVGEGKDATVIFLDHANWQGTPSPADPSRSYMFDLQSFSVTDCMISDMRIDGAARNLTSNNGTQPAPYCGVLCSARNLFERVSIYDVWGYGLWIFGQNAAWTTLVDCEADRGTNGYTGTGGNDTIGGGGVRTKIVRFYWMPKLAKNSALDFTAPGGTLSEVSVDIIDCINESPLDILLEGCNQSSVRGSRLYGNNLHLTSDAHYSHTTVQNPMDILVADNVFVGLQPPQGGSYVGGKCYVAFDGGTIYCGSKTLLNNGGRIAIQGNTFITSAGKNPSQGEPGSAIRWTGDDASNSDGGSIIAGNRIYNPNPNGITASYDIMGSCSVDLGSELGCGISVLSSYGLTIGRNAINDTRTPELMQYSIQFFSATGLASGATMGRIIVQDNLCGSAIGVGRGSLGTFYPNPNPTTLLPLPILRGNTDQDDGYDLTASTQISSAAFNGVPWPGAGWYAYDAYIYVSGGHVTSIYIDATNTGRTDGAFYLAANHTVTITWTTQPNIEVFRMAT